MARNNSTGAAEVLDNLTSLLSSINHNINPLIGTWCLAAQARAPIRNLVGHPEVAPEKGANIMADDLSKTGPADRSRINLIEPHEVQYWADKFGVSKERLSEAVRKVGHSADAVSRVLKVSQL